MDPRTYAIHAVNLLPDYPLSADEDYKLYAEDLNEREIEFAKALCLTGGNQTRALLMVQPDLVVCSARNISAKLYKNRDVKDLHAHLTSLLCREHEPVTLEYIISKFEHLFRQTESPREAMALGQKIIEYRGMDMTGGQIDGSGFTEEDEAFLMDFLADERNRVDEVRNADRN